MANVIPVKGLRSGICEQMKPRRGGMLLDAYRAIDVPKLLECSMEAV
jgi:hypothetical protein